MKLGLMVGLLIALCSCGSKSSGGGEPSQLTLREQLTAAEAKERIINDYSAEKNCVGENAELPYLYGEFNFNGGQDQESEILVKGHAVGLKFFIADEETAVLEVQSYLIAADGSFSSEDEVTTEYHISQWTLQENNLVKASFYNDDGSEVMIEVVVDFFNTREYEGEQAYVFNIQFGKAAGVILPFPFKQDLKGEGGDLPLLKTRNEYYCD